MIVVRLLLLGMLLVSACAPARRVLHPPDASGFLDDYSLLRQGGPGEVGLVYRNPDAAWTTYDKVLLEPVTLWRSGRGSLTPVPEADLARLISDFEAAIRKRLGDGFELVDQPGPGVMRIRLAITEARASDPVLDVLSARGDDVPRTTGDGPLDPETRRFLEGAAIEGEMRDGVTNVLLAQGVERRRAGGPRLDTWADIDRGLAFWCDRVCGRLEARTRRR